MKAILFDCDGVLVDTERDGHRIAFNRAFAEAGLDVQWSVDGYGDLLRISGGKERMREFFRNNTLHGGQPVADDTILALHKRKTDIFMDLINQKQLPLRPGVKRIVDEASSRGILLAVCSTSNERAVQNIVRNLLGEEPCGRFGGIYAGDVVPKKKPDPAVYRLALTELAVEADEALVIEDSRNGLLAALGAGCQAVITKSGYTRGEDFAGAALVLNDLGDPPHSYTTLNDLISAHDRAVAGKKRKIS